MDKLVAISLIVGYVTLGSVLIELAWRVGRLFFSRIREHWGRKKSLFQPHEFKCARCGKTWTLQFDATGIPSEESNRIVMEIHLHQRNHDRESAVVGSFQ